MPSLYSVNVPDARPHFTARKRDAVKLGREWSRGGVRVEVVEIEAARLPLLDLLSAALNGEGWSEGEPVTVAAFLDGIELRLEAPPEAAEPRPAPQVRERVRQPVAASPRVRERVRTVSVRNTWTVRA